VVVSPHLDDAILSLGAAMASWVRAGSAVELLTVLAGDPDSDASAGGWDARAGFGSEGEGARARRTEDARAAAFVGVQPRWLSFGYQDYERHGDVDAVREATLGAIGDRDALLLPGFPLSHPDHEWLVRTVLAGPLPGVELGFYVEQPYGMRFAGDRTPPEALGALGSQLAFADLEASARDRAVKWRAIGAYRSQLPLLALGPRARIGLARTTEAVAWVGAGDRPGI
jgi:LmbE family N-acetylglucosaminyl deacetylase